MSGDKKIPATVDHQGVPRLQGNPLGPGNLLQLPSVDGPVMGHPRLAPVLGYVQQDPTGGDAVGPLVHGPEGSPVEGYLLPRVPAVPHPVLVPHVAEGIQVGSSVAMVEDAVVVAREPARAPGSRGHPVVGRRRAQGIGALGEVAAQGHRPARTDQAGGGDPLLRGDEVDCAQLIVLAPSAPVTALCEIRTHLLEAG